MHRLICHHLYGSPAPRVRERILPGPARKIPVLYERFQAKSIILPPKGAVRSGFRKINSRFILKTDELADRLRDAAPKRASFTVHQRKILPKLLPLPEGPLNRKVIFGGRREDRLIQCSRKLLHHALLLRLAAVERQTVIAETALAQPVQNDVQRGHFLGHKKDLLPVCESLGNDIGDRLAFARAGRSHEDKTDALSGHTDRVQLTCVRVHDLAVLKIGDPVMVKVPGILIRQLQAGRIAAEGPDDRILKDPVLILQKIPVHNDFQEGKESQIRFLMHSPAAVLYELLYEIKICEDSLLGVKIRKIDPEKGI